MAAIVNSKTPRMDIMSDEFIETLARAIKTVDPNVAIDTVDYFLGRVFVSMRYNKGTEHEFVQKDFIEVNVNADSNAAAFHDVYNAVYDRCI